MGRGILLLIGYIICVSGICIFVFNELSTINIRSCLGMFTIIMSCIVFLFFKQLNWPSHGTLYSCVKCISKLSLAIYLCHMLIYSTITSHLYIISSSPLFQMTVIVLTFISAYCLSWILYKLPFHKYIIGT